MQKLCLYSILAMLKILIYSFWQMQNFNSSSKFEFFYTPSIFFVSDRMFIPILKLSLLFIAIDLKSKDPEVLTGTEICYRGCGRYYHFSQKCCTQVHHLKWAGTEVSYIVMRQQIFLEKCAVFYILGRMCVVRFGDYRTVDRHLTSAGLEIHKNFMYENSIEKPMEVNPGGRR